MLDVRVVHAGGMSDGWLLESMVRVIRLLDQHRRWTVNYHHMPAAAAAHINMLLASLQSPRTTCRPEVCASAARSHLHQKPEKVGWDDAAQLW